MEHKKALNVLDMKNVISAENFDSKNDPQSDPFGGQKSSVVLVEAGGSTPSGSHREIQLEQPRQEYEHLANSANSEMIRVSNQSHQSGALRGTSNLQPVTHIQETRPGPQEVQRPGKSHTQVVQPAHHSVDNRGFGGSGVQALNGQLQQISRNIKDGRVPIIAQENRQMFRPASQSPQSLNPPSISFNYNFSNPNLRPPQPQPQYPPQPQPQPQYLPQPQPQYPPPPHYSPQPQHNFPPLPPPPSQPMPSPSPSDQNQQILLWQSRYFTVIQRFQFVYVRFQSITRQVIIIRQRIQKCSDPKQLTELKQKMTSLQNQIVQTEQHMVELVNRNKEVLGDTVNWKVKYEQSLAQIQVLLKERREQGQQMKPSAELGDKLQELQKQLIVVKNHHGQALKKYKQSKHKIKTYQQEIVRLNGILEQMGSDSQNNAHDLTSLNEIIKNKDEEISMLRMLVDQQKYAISGEDQSLKQNKILFTLKQEKEDLARQLKRINDELEAYKRATEERIGKYQVQSQYREEEIHNYRSLVEEKLKVIQTLKQSNVSTNQGKLPTVPNISHEEELRVLRQKLQVAQNDIRQYQQNKLYMENVTNEIVNQKDALYGKVEHLQQQLSKRNTNLTDMQDKISYLEEQLNTHQGSSKQIEIDYQELSDNLQNLKRQYNQKVNEAEQYSKRYMESQRFLTNASQELNNLKYQYDKLNLQRSTQITQESPEVVALRQRVKNLERDLSSERGENDSLRAEIQRLEIDKRKIKNNQSNQFNEQYVLMEENLAKKDQQIIRLRQNSQLLQTNIDELTLQLEKIKIKAANDFKTGQNEKSDLKNQIMGLEFKLGEYERKISSLDEMRGIMQQQVNTLSTDLNSKSDILQRVQIELKQERARVKSFETDLQSHLDDTEDIRVKLKESQKKSQSLVKSLQAQLDKKKEELVSKTSELSLVTNKIADLSSGIKIRDAQLSQLERNNETYKMKISSFDTYIQEIKYLKQKITEYQSKVSSLAFRPISRKPNTEPTQIFERKVIYQLKMENQALRQQLGMAAMPQSNGATRDEEIEVRERLTDFNQKLEEIIGQNWTGGDLSQEQTQLFKKYERDRRKLIQRHNEQITQLKVRILQLQNSTNSMNQYTQYIYEQPTKQFSAISVYNQQILFYKQKNQQLEEMVESHIKVNKELKESIEKLMKGHQEEYSIIYYKEQLTIANELNINLQEKLRRLQNELKKMKEELGKYTQRPADTHSELEIRIVELNRRISQLVVEINQLQQDKIICNERVQNAQRQVQKIRFENDELQVSKQEMITQFKDNERRLEEDAVKLNNKIKVQQSEIQRLNEALSKKSSTESTEIKTLKIKISDLQEQIRKFKIRIEELSVFEDKYKRESSKYESQVLFWQNEIQKYKDSGDAALRKHKEYEAQIVTFRGTIADYEGRLRNKDASFEEFNYKETQLQQEIARLKSQVSLLTQEIERINEFSQKKLSEKDGQIQRTKLVITEKDQQISSLEYQLNQSKIYILRANEAGQQILALQEEINRLKNLLVIKSSQYDRSTQDILSLQGRFSLSERQIEDLRRSADVKASEFSAIISRLEAQLADGKRSKNDSQFQLTNTIARLQGELRQAKRSKDVEINELKIKISRLEAQVRQLEQANDNAKQLHNAIANLEVQLEELRRRKDMEVNQLNITISNLEFELKQCQIKDQNSSELSVKIRTLEQQIQQITRAKDSSISELNIVISNLKIQIRELQYAKTELLGLVEINRRLEIEIGELKEQREEEKRYYQGIIRQREEEKSYLQGLVRQREEEKKSLSGKVRQLEEENKSLSSLIKQRDEELKYLQGLVQHREQELGALEVIVRQKELEIKSFGTILLQREEEKKALQLRVKQLEEEKRSFQVVIRQRGEELQHLQGIILQKEQELKHLQGIIRQAEEEKKYFQGLIRQLEEEISRLKNGKSNSEEGLDALRKEISKLEAEVRLLREQMSIKERSIAELTQQNQSLTIEIQSHQQEISQLRITITQIESNLTALQDAYEGLLRHSRYTIEYLRSILISVEVLIEQDGKIDFAISQTIGKEIACGLQEIQQWHKA